MKLIARAFCKIVGHIYDDQEYGYCERPLCLRCGKPCHPRYQNYDTLSYWIWRLHLPERWERFKSFFRRCEDCGKRFGRHDDTKPHIPF